MLLMLSQGHGVNVTANNLDVVQNSDVVWVAVKPHIVPAVLREVSPAVRKDQLFISVAAGTTLSSLAKVRVCTMPTLYLHHFLFLSCILYGVCRLCLFRVVCDGYTCICLQL